MSSDDDTPFQQEHAVESALTPSSPQQYRLHRGGRNVVHQGPFGQATVIDVSMRSLAISETATEAFVLVRRHAALASSPTCQSPLTSTTNVSFVGQLAPLESPEAYPLIGPRHVRERGSTSIFGTTAIS